jgi:L-type amino acid transporter 9
MFPALLTYINFVSVKLFVRVQNVFTVSKLVACVIIIVTGVYAICAGK